MSDENGQVWHLWPMWMWADLTSVDEEGQEQMREELLTAHDLYGFAFPDEEAVFAYLDDTENDLGDTDAEVSALDIAKLWKDRYSHTYEYWSDRADAWIGIEGGELLKYLYGVATSAQTEVLDELKTQFGKALAGDESGEYCYIDRTSTGGGILCLKRRDD